MSIAGVFSNFSSSGSGQTTGSGQPGGGDPSAAGGATHGNGQAQAHQTGIEEVIERHRRELAQDMQARAQRYQSHLNDLRAKIYSLERKEQELKNRIRNESDPLQVRKLVDQKNTAYWDRFFANFEYTDTLSNLSSTYISAAKFGLDVS